MQAPPDLPAGLEELVDLVAGMRGVAAVVLGGSRALGTNDPGSDCDLGVYYRGDLDTTALAKRGTVYPPGAWGRVMNGGAWLTCDGAKVDVLLRDLDVVDHWSERAEQGIYEVDALLGYVAGVPTYSLRAERSIARLLRGSLTPVLGFPERLSTTGKERWMFHSRFSFEQARMRARRGDVVGTVGQSAKAVTEHAHALLCARREWVLNEKRIVERAGLESAHASFARVPRDASGLERWVEEIEQTIHRDREDLSP
jgi:hypothetical protein